MTLWGKQAEQYNESEINPVIAFKAVKVGEYNGAYFFFSEMPLLNVVQAVALCPWLARAVCSSTLISKSALLFAGGMIHPAQSKPSRHILPLLLGGHPSLSIEQSYAVSKKLSKNNMVCQANQNTSLLGEPSCISRVILFPTPHVPRMAVTKKSKRSLRTIGDVRSVIKAMNGHNIGG